jgi:hypothetical protein
MLMYWNMRIAFMIMHIVLDLQENGAKKQKMYRRRYLGHGSSIPEPMRPGQERKYLSVTQDSDPVHEPPENQPHHAQQ